MMQLPWSTMCFHIVAFQYPCLMTLFSLLERLGPRSSTPDHVSMHHDSVLLGLGVLSCTANPTDCNHRSNMSAETIRHCLQQGPLSSCS